MHTLAFGLLLLFVGMMLTALLRLRATGGDVAFFGGGVSGFLGFGAAVTVIPLVARILATALASDFLGLGALGGGFRTDKVMESDRCMTLLSPGSGALPW